jgi:hypothetical protein
MGYKCVHCGGDDSICGQQLCKVPLVREGSSPLPYGHKERKNTPLVRGCLDYFPAALAAVAQVSKAGNDQHNPGQEMHHARGKSSDHADCILRHLTDRGTLDSDGLRHSAKVAWRALALLQEELEAEGAPLARGARLPETSFTPTYIGGGPQSPGRCVL